jgi:hypothetical protein
MQVRFASWVIGSRYGANVGERTGVSSPELLRYVAVMNGSQHTT